MIFVKHLCSYRVNLPLVDKQIQRLSAEKLAKTVGGVDEIDRKISTLVSAATEVISWPALLDGN